MEVDGRRDAVLRALDFLHSSLSRDGYAPLLRLGGQCVSMFFDVFLTEADALLCEHARGHGLSLLKVLAQHWQSNAWPQPWSSDQLLEVLAAVRYEPFGFDMADLLARADDAVTGIDMEHLTVPGHLMPDWRNGQLATSAWFSAAMDAFTLAYCDGLYPGRFPRPRVGMREVLSSLRRHVFEAPCQVSASSDYGECHYLATHLCYWLSAYSATLELRDAPWLLGYVKACLGFWLGQAELCASGQPGEASDGLVYVDLDGLAECTDVLRAVQPSADCTEPSHLAFLAELPPLLARATKVLLASQLADGSWPPSVHPKDVRRAEARSSRALGASSFPHGLAARMARSISPPSFALDSTPDVRLPPPQPLRSRLKRVAVKADVPLEAQPLDQYEALYDALHPTWAATMALCERPPAATGGERQQLALEHTERMRALVRETRFHTQDVPKYAKRRLRGGRTPRGS